MPTIIENICAIVPSVCGSLPGGPGPTPPIWPGEEVLQRYAELIRQNEETLSSRQVAMLSKFVHSYLFLESNFADASVVLTNQLAKTLPKNARTQLAAAFQAQADAYAQINKPDQAELAKKISTIYQGA
jgi:hypothetical protein